MLTNRQFQRYLIVSLLLVLSLNLLALPHLIQAQTDLDQSEEASEESTISNIKKVIQDKQVELEQSDKLDNVKQAYLAQVKRVSAETLTLSTNKGDKILPVTEELQIIKDQKLVDIDSITIDSWVVVYGLLVDDSFVAKQLNVTGKDFTQDVRQVLLGSITDINSNSLQVRPRSSEQTISLNLDKSTDFLDVEGEATFLNNFYEDLQCLVIAKEKTAGQWTISSIKALAKF